MSRAEHDAMVVAGRVLPTTVGLDMEHVTVPPDSTASQAAPAGSVFVEFDVIDAQVSPGGISGWLIVYGASSIQGRLAMRQGQTVAGLPRVGNVVVMEAD